MECSVQKCHREAGTRGLCHAHYQRWIRSGVWPTEPILEGRERAERRFFAKVKKLPSGHWMWVGSKDGAGYGRVWWDGRGQQAHRVSWEMVNEPIPEGLVIDHLCRVPACVNPEHMQVATRQTNTLRGDANAARNAAKTHCKRGHEFTPDNTGRGTGGRRVCLACRADPEVMETNRAAQRRRYHRRKAEGEPADFYTS
jgi:hypothetical protein